MAREAGNQSYCDTNKTVTKKGNGSRKPPFSGHGSGRREDAMMNVGQCVQAPRLWQCSKVFNERRGDAVMELRHEQGKNYAERIVALKDHTNGYFVRGF